MFFKIFVIGIASDVGQIFLPCKLRSLEQFTQFLSFLWLRMKHLHLFGQFEVSFVLL